MTKNKVQKFLEKYHLAAEQVDLRAELDGMLLAMNAGLTTDGAADDVLPLAMLPTFIDVDNKVPYDKPCIVLDAGGTNFRVAVLTLHKEGEPGISDFAVYPMPGSDRELSKNEFYDKIVEFLAPVIDKSDDIGFCFSYPAEIMKNRDGKVLSFTKEVRAPEVVGGLIGEELKAALSRNGYNANKNICILNDTVAALLGGRMGLSNDLYDSFIGFILGTGCNVAYTESNAAIKKIQELLTPLERTKRMIINVESGYHHPLFSSEIEKEMDESTIDPGNGLLEKRVAGRYLGLLGMYTIRKAIEENLFSKFFVENFSQIYELTTKDLDDYVREPFGQACLSHACANDIDRSVLYFIIDNLFERCARYVVCTLAAVLVKAGTGRSPVKPTVVTVDGSTYYRTLLVQNKVAYYIRDFINNELGLYVCLNNTANANLVGAAIAALTNHTDRAELKAD